MQKQRNLFKEGLQKLPDSFLPGLFILSVVGLVISCVAFYEDYWTSVFGYELLPTQKANDWVGYFIAAIPQVAQILLAYSWATQGQDWMGKLAIGLHVLDVATDVLYKADGLGVLGYFIAFLESELAYTIGSEILLVLSFGLIVHLGPKLFPWFPDLTPKEKKGYVHKAQVPPQGQPNNFKKHNG